MPHRYIDIAVNLTDDMFQGNYRGKQLHPADLDDLVIRSKSQGVERMILTGTSLQSSRDSLALARKYGYHATIGCHPTSTTEINSHPAGVEAYFSELGDLIQEELEKGQDSRCIAVGEIGLDYDRLSHSPISTQTTHLPRLLSLAQTYSLPLFLHSRHPDAHVDLIKAFGQTGWKKESQMAVDEWINRGRGVRGVVHSFTGTELEMKELLEYGLFIGINGCSLKTKENLDLIKLIPLDRIMLETDAPWCSITSTAASHAYLSDFTNGIEKTKKFSADPKQGVKGRNEPGDITQVAHVVAKVKGVEMKVLTEAAWRNTMSLFYPDERVE